jgi:septum formation protein
LGVPFSVRHPLVNETIRETDSVIETVSRLSREKALSVPKKTNEIIIGSDQLGELNELAFGKPLSRDENINQLLTFSGQIVSFYTSLFVIRVRDQEVRKTVVVSKLKFRNLTHEDAAFYVENETALESAGGFKLEGLGISLLEEFYSNDPTAIIGLPLIETARFLRELNY